MRIDALPLRPIRGYSFSNFSTNKQVASARSTIMRYVSEARPYGCHTLVLGGPESSGKTHLLNAAGHAALVNGVFRTALLHKSEGRRDYPSPRRSYTMAPTGTVLGRPSCEKRLSRATRTCNSTTCRSNVRAITRWPRRLKQCILVSTRLLR